MAMDNWSTGVEQLVDKIQQDERRLIPISGALGSLFDDLSHLIRRRGKTLSEFHVRQGGAGHRLLKETVICVMVWTNLAVARNEVAKVRKESSTGEPACGREASGQPSYQLCTAVREAMLSAIMDLQYMWCNSAGDVAGYQEMRTSFVLSILLAIEGESQSPSPATPTAHGAFPSQTPVAGGQQGKPHPPPAPGPTPRTKMVPPSDTSRKPRTPMPNPSSARRHRTSPPHSPPTALPPPPGHSQSCVTYVAGRACPTPSSACREEQWRAISNSLTSMGVNPDTIRSMITFERYLSVKGEPYFYVEWPYPATAQEVILAARKSRHPGRIERARRPERIGLRPVAPPTPPAPPRTKRTRWGPRPPEAPPTPSPPADPRAMEIAQPEEQPVQDHPEARPAHERMPCTDDPQPMDVEDHSEGSASKLPAPALAPPPSGEALPSAPPSTPTSGPAEARSQDSEVAQPIKKRSEDTAQTIAAPQSPFLFGTDREAAAPTEPEAGWTPIGKGGRPRKTRKNVRGPAEGSQTPPGPHSPRGKRTEAAPSSPPYKKATDTDGRPRATDFCPHGWSGKHLGHSTPPRTPLAFRFPSPQHPPRHSSPQASPPSTPQSRPVSPTLTYVDATRSTLPTSPALAHAEVTRTPPHSPTPSLHLEEAEDEGEQGPLLPTDAEAGAGPSQEAEVTCSQDFGLSPDPSQSQDRPSL